MTDAVHYARKGRVGVITIDNPPVNALGQAVRQGLLDALAAAVEDTQAQAIVVLGDGRTFPAGADIREFGQPAQAPALPDVIDAFEACDKLVLAAIHGSALGGGLEVALGCDYRVAVASARLGLPEVNLGLLPGAGGTQRLPRLIGAQAALEFMVEGKPANADQALALGLIDAVIEGELPAAGLAYAEQLIDDNAPLRPVWAMHVTPPPSNVFSRFESGIARRKRGFPAPTRIIKAVRTAVLADFDDGMARERELFSELLHSPESAAQRHVFFAERAVARVDGIAGDTPTRDIQTVGIIGAGTMGGGIAMNFLSAGMPVTLVEQTQAALDNGVAIVRANYEASADKGRISYEQVEACMQRLSTTLSYDDLSTVDLIIEAVFENMQVKKNVFAELDRVAKKGAILASNTSTLDIDEIAASISRPADVIGMHFFSPANVMKLLEVVRGKASGGDVVATVMALGKRIRKVAVCVGVCDGFVGNRILHQRQKQALALVAEGASPEHIDEVIRDFGLPMGPFAMWDLAGLDIIYRIREGERETHPDKAPERDWLDELVEAGRLGQKTGAGIFDYVKGDRTPRPARRTAELITAYRMAHYSKPREVTDVEIRERCLYAMVNEGAKILEEGIAARALDIDVVWIYGYGWPVYRGGPMYWADQIGLPTILGRIRELFDETGDEVWRPAGLLTRCVEAGHGFGDI